MYTRRFNIQKFCILPTMYLCVVLWISEQTAIISLYITNLPIFITVAECLLRSTNWVFKCDRSISSLKGT
jgi:hypothetical protein